MFVSIFCWLSTVVYAFITVVNSSKVDLLVAADTIIYADGEVKGKIRSLYIIMRDTDSLF